MPEVLRIDSLPEAALEAAARFHSQWQGKTRALLQSVDSLVVVLPPAPYDHTDWRRAAARDLARAHTPVRINVVSGTDEASIERTIEYLARASGVTGQYLPLNDAK